MSGSATAEVSRLPARILDLPVGDLTLGDDFRIDDDPEALRELAASIAQLGVLQPLIVRQRSGGWEVVCGRRRLGAARMAGLETVPCVQRSIGTEEAADVALAENLHRRWLSPIEEGLAYSRLRGQGLTIDAIARRAGRSRSTVANMLALLKLPARTRNKIHRGQLSYAVALRPQHQPPTGKRQGSDDGLPRALSDDASLIISHWRRRHDRLIAGIQAIVRAPDADYRALLRRLLRLDEQPLDEQ